MCDDFDTRTCRPTLCYRDRLSLRLPVLPRMLLYPHSFAGLPLLYQVAGSAIPRAVVPALMSMALTLIIEACNITRTNQHSHVAGDRVA